MKSVVSLGDRKLYRLQPKQLQAYRLTPLSRRDGPKHIGYGGAAGGGKSYLARAVAVAAAFQWPGSRGIIFRRTKGQVKQNHLNMLRREIPKRIGGKQLYTVNKSDLVVSWANGSETWFGHLRIEDDKDTHQGQEYDLMVFEEATHYSWATVRWLVGNRLRATVDGSRPFALYPSNPGNVGHQWYKRLFIDRIFDPRLKERPEDYAFVQALVDDNRVLVERDPEYLAQLDTLPEPYYSWLRKGDFTSGMGLALTMLRRDRHLIEAFQPPVSWPLWGAFDWGYDHPFSFGLYTRDEDGRTFCIDTVSGRHLMPWEIAERIVAMLQSHGILLQQLQSIECGHDVDSEQRARGQATPSIRDQFVEWDVRFSCMRVANYARIHGLNNLRKFLTVPGDHSDPYLMFMETEGNRGAFDQLLEIPTDPRNVEDALKVDADIFGNGGDDHYDQVRYAVAKLQPPAASSIPEHQIHAFDPDVLVAEARELRRVRTPRPEPPIDPFCLAEIL